MSATPEKVLIVDGDDTFLNMVENFLVGKKIKVIKCPNWEQAIYQYNHNKIDLVIVELALQDLPGPVLAQKFRAHEIPSKQNPGFIMVGNNNKNSGEEYLVKELGDMQFMKKPINLPALLGAIGQAIAMAVERQKIENIQNKVLRPLLKAGKTDKAMKVAREQLIPMGTRGQFLATKIFERGENYDEALEQLNKLYTNDHSNMQYLNSIGKIRLITGHVDAAREALEKADGIAPNNIDRLNHMAELYMALKDPVGSKKIFENLIELHPENKEMKFDFFQKLKSGGYLQEARELCKSTTTPLELIRYYNNKGVIFSKQEKFTEAIQEYQKARDLIPEAKELYRILYNMALAHINLKNIESIKIAQSLLEETIDLKPDFVKAQEKLAVTEKYLSPKKEGA